MTKPTPTDVTFNDFDLQDANHVITNIRHDNPPERQLDKQAVAKAEGELFIDALWRAKKIEATGYVTGTDAADLDDKIDNMTYELAAKEKELSISFGDTNRVYTATVEDLKFEREHHTINSIPFNITFDCDAFSQNTTVLSNSWEGIASSPLTPAITVSGTRHPLPVLTFDVNTANSMASLTFTNTTTSSAITITPDNEFADADQLVIDTENKYVSLNGQDQDYSGQLPIFNPNILNNMRLDFTASTSILEQQTAYDSNAGNALTGASYYMAQGVQVVGAQTVSKVECFMRYEDADTDGSIDVTLEIQTDSAGEPSGTAVTNGTKTITIPYSASHQWYEFEFATAPSLSGSTQYWLVVSSDCSGSYQTIHYWAKKASSDPYSKGSFSDSLDAGSNWSNHANDDLTFKLYGAEFSGFDCDFTIDYKRLYLN